jgi:hypothetical protein
MNRIAFKICVHLQRSKKEVSRRLASKARNRIQNIWLMIVKGKVIKSLCENYYHVIILLLVS